MAQETNARLSEKRQGIINDINRLTAEKASLDNDITNLTTDKNALIEEIGDIDTEDTLKFQKNSLDDEIAELNTQKTGLDTNVTELESKKTKLEKEIGVLSADNTFPGDSLQAKKIKLNKEIKQLDIDYQNKEAEINKEVNIIKDIASFKQETVTNMGIYKTGMVFAFLLLLTLIIFASFSIYDTLTLFRAQIGSLPTGMFLKSTDWIISALSIVIIKLPIAFLFVGGMFLTYKIFISLFKVYEKINNEKRKISTIEALVNQLNKESVSIISGEELDWEDNSSVKRAKDKIKWEAISKYFEALPNDNSHDDSSIKAENALLKEIFMKKKRKISASFPGGTIEADNKD